MSKPSIIICTCIWYPWKEYCGILNGPFHSYSSITSYSNEIPIKSPSDHHMEVSYSGGIHHLFYFRFPSINHPAIGVYIYTYISYYRRKFRSQTQTSDNMDRWKAETGRVREKRRVEERRSEGKESAERSSDARKGRKVAKHWVFPMIWGSGGSKSRLAKAAGAEPSGQMRDEKVHAVVAQSTCASEKAKNTSCSEYFWKLKCRKSGCLCGWSTFRSQNVQNTPGPDHFWKLRCRKSARRCGAKQISKSKCTKHTRSGPLLEVEMSKKCTPLWHEAHFEVNMLKKTKGFGPLLHAKMSFRVAGARGCAPSQIWAKREGFAACPKTMTGVGHLKRNCKDAFRARSGRWFPERRCILEHQICRFVKMILRDKCSTSYDLASLFRGRRSTLDRWSGKTCKTHWYEVVSAALNFSFLKEASQNCFVFDVVEFKNWRSLVELFRFWCCQVQKLRKSRRIAAILMLSSSKPEDISLNCSVLKLADRQIDR